MIKLGQKVKDKVTGFQGIAITKCIYLNGCIQYSVQPPVNEKGESPKSNWVDEGQLIVVDHGILPEPLPEPEEELKPHATLQEISVPSSRPYRSGRGGGHREHPHD